jgi:hypothetical protein
MSKYEFWWKFIERPRRILEGWYRIATFTNTNAYQIQREANKYRGQLVIDGFDVVVRLLGWTDQYEDDYYWVIWKKGKVELHSCVGGFCNLKGYLKTWDYIHLDYLYELNWPTDNAYPAIKDKKIILK